MTDDRLRVEGNGTLNPGAGTTPEDKLFAVMKEFLGNRQRIERNVRSLAGGPEARVSVEWVPHASVLRVGFLILVLALLQMAGPIVTLQSHRHEADQNPHP
jgi:hypothetical protein